MKVNPDKVFLRRAKKLLKKNPNLKKAYEELYIKLANDPFDPSLHTHALTGPLKGKYACSLTYELKPETCIMHPFFISPDSELPTPNFLSASQR